MHISQNLATHSSRWEEGTSLPPKMHTHKKCQDDSREIQHTTLSRRIQVKEESEPAHKMILMVPMILRSQSTKQKSDHTVESALAV